MFLCGELRYVVSHDSSLSRLFPMSIPASLVVVYSYGAGVVPKSGCRQRKATLSTILIQVDVVLVLAWIWRYAASKSIFPIRICLVRRLFFMA